MKKKTVKVIFLSIIFGLLNCLSVFAVPETSWDLSLGSIAEAYSEYFTIGNIMEPNQINDSDITEMYKYCYNFVTSENSMKPASLTREKGVYNFTNADKLVEWANANNILVHGHTLVWHSQSARWLTLDNDGNVLTREEARANMEDYINTVAGHYTGKVVSWDVVNEAIATSVPSIPLNWRNVLRKDESGYEGSTWYQAYENGADKDKGESGADYIYDAFVFARLADPNVILYYNDYNETMSGKREAIATMVEELNEQWKNDSRNTEPDRLLIEGIGMQAHYWTSDLNVSDVEKTIKRFIRTGAEISVSELDIPHGNWSNYTERTVEPTHEEELLQADFYRKLFNVYKEYSDNIARVTFWGKADPQSWRREGYPTLFNKDFAAKEAYRVIMETAGTGLPKIEDENVTLDEIENNNTENEERNDLDNNSNNKIDNAENANDSGVSSNNNNVNDTDSSVNTGNNSVTILLITAVILAAVIIIIVIFLKNRKK